VDEWKNQDSFRYISFTKHSQNANLKYPEVLRRWHSIWFSEEKMCFNEILLHWHPWNLWSKQTGHYCSIHSCSRKI